jgi:MFS family permease
MLVVLCAVGLARFAFGMVLPAMARGLGLDYAEQGMLGASYFVGYLGVVTSMPWLAPRLGSRRLCIGGLWLVVLGLFGMSLWFPYPMLLASYAVVGIGSGAAFVGAMSLPSMWFHPSHRARAAGVATAGAGVGVLCSGLFIPGMLDIHVVSPWKLTWLTFAATALVCALLSAAILRNRPADMGLTPFGRAVEPAGTSHGTSPKNIRVKPFLLHLGLIYSLFAATLLTYTTFIVTTMVDGLSISTAQAGLLWAGVGGLSIFSGPIFGALSDRFGHRIGMSAALLSQGLAFALVAMDSGTAGLYASIVLFGISAWSMPSIVAAAAGDYLGPERAASGFAILTLMFAVGQVVGPASAGVLAEWSGGFALAYGVAAGLNLIAVALCPALPAAPRI